MFFSAQKNKCCSLDFHQDHNIYYRAEICIAMLKYVVCKKAHKMYHLKSRLFGNGILLKYAIPKSTIAPIKNRNAANRTGGNTPFPNFITTKLNPQNRHNIIIKPFIRDIFSLYHLICPCYSPI